MRIRKLLLTLAAILTSAVGAQADDGHTFPVEGKIYVIHRYADQNSYIYESGTALNASASMNTQKQYWRFIPTDNANCYYIQNVTSGNYVQSSKTVGLEQQIRTGSSPVEFQIKQNTTSGAAPKGYYYMCSTDQNIQTSADGTWGLNYQQSTGRVVAFHIRYNRPNSYWDIVESNYDYEAPQPVAHTDLQKRLGIYYLPCGTAAAYWLKSLSVSGSDSEVPDALHYSATAQPSSYYYLVRTDSATVYTGKTFTLAYEAQGVTSASTVTAYFDWDKDGVFEDVHNFESQTEASASITVPDTAKIGVVRMRIRLNDNGMDAADDDVSGHTYDFFLSLQKNNIAEGIDDAKVAAKGTPAASAAYSVEGKPVRLDAYRGIYIQSGQKKIK